MPAPERSGSRARASFYAGVYENAFYGPARVLARGTRLTLVLGPKRRRFALVHWDADTFSYDWQSENTYGVSAVDFTPGPRRARSLRIKNLDLEGLGTFTRARESSRSGRRAGVPSTGRAIGSSPRLAVRFAAGRGRDGRGVECRRPYPRPMSGIFGGITVMYWTFASSGIPAMSTTVADMSHVHRRLDADRTSGLSHRRLCLHHPKTPAGNTGTSR